MSQFQNFNELPRCEVQALWSILAFVAAIDSRSGAKASDADACWRFATKLVLCGTRVCKTRPEASGGSGQLLPPSGAQLDCCQTEISFLASILHAGAAAKWTPSDTDVVGIFKRAILLQADDYALNETSRTSVLPSSNGQRNDMKKVKRLWSGVAVGSESLSLAGSTPSATDTIAILEVADDAVGILFGQPAVLPSSLITRQCLSLLSAWVQKVPAKKALFNRFVNTMKALAQFFIDEALDAEKKETTGENSPTSAPDLFALAFSSTASSGSGSNRKSLYLREVAAYVKVVSALSVKWRLTSMQSNENGMKTLSLVGLAEEVRKQYI